MTLATDIAIIDADTIILHNVIHGTSGQSVITEGGTIPTVAKRLFDLGTGVVRGAWVTATAYALNDVASNGGLWYRCSVAHTSAAAFATDLTALKWIAANSPTYGVYPVDTLTDLRNLTTKFDNVMTRGYTAVGDGASGLYWWNSADARTDTGGDIIQPTAGGVGRWNLLTSSQLSAIAFGAKGDGVTDNTTALQAWLNSTSKDLYLPAGTYLTDRLTTAVPDRTIRLAKGAILKMKNGATFDAAGCWIIKITTAGIGTVIDGGIFDGNNTNQVSSSVAISGITKATTAVVTATAHGRVNGEFVYLSGIVGMTELNGKSGQVQNVTANTFELTGVNSTGFTTYTSGGTVQKTWGFSASLIYIDRVANCSVTGTILRNSAWAGIFVCGPLSGVDPFPLNTHIHNNEISGCWDRGIYCWNGFLYGRIHNNYIHDSPGGGIGVYADVVTNGNSIGVNVSENTIIMGGLLIRQPLCIELNGLLGSCANSVVADNIIYGSQTAGSATTWAISLDTAPESVVSGNVCKYSLLYGIELVKPDRTVVVGNFIDGALDGVIVNGATGPVTITGNTFRGRASTHYAVDFILGTNNLGHIINGNTFYEYQSPILFNGVGSGSVVSANSFLPGAAAYTFTIATLTTVDNILFDGNWGRQTAAGYGFSITLSGNRHRFTNNVFTGGSPAATACVLIPASASRCVVTGNQIRGYTNGVTSSASVGKNVVGNNQFEGVTTPTTLHGTDTSYNNTDQT